MTKIGRFHGAVLIETSGEYFLVGDLKEPADFSAAGFVEPEEISPLENKYVSLQVNGEVTVSAPEFVCDQSGEPFLESVFHRLVIKRNGSVSMRLWRLLLDADESDSEAPDISWLFAMPEEIWEIVQDQVLRC